MKKLALTMLTVGLLFLANGCKTTQEKELTGYRFANEWAETEPFSSDDLTGSITIDMYIKLHSYPSNWTSIIYKLQSDNNNEFNLRLRNGNAAQWYYGYGRGAIIINWNPKEHIPLNEWVRLTALRNIDNNTMELLINNKSVYKIQRRLHKAYKTDRKIIMMGSGRRTIDATLAEVRIWSRPLTSDELLKTAFSIRRPEREKSLQGYWIFDEDSDCIIKDLSSSGRDLVIKKL